MSGVEFVGFLVAAHTWIVDAWQIKHKTSNINGLYCCWQIIIIATLRVQQSKTNLLDIWLNARLCRVREACQAGTFLKQTLLLLEHWPAFDEFDHSISLISLSILHSNKYIFYACIALLLSMRAPITFAIINSIIINNSLYFVLKIYAIFSSVIDQWIKKKNTFKSTRVLRVMSIHTTTTKKS